MSSSQTLPDFSMKNRDDEYRQSVLDHECERRVDRLTVSDGPLFVTAEEV